MVSRKETRELNESLSVLSLMRREGLSLKEAARRLDVPQRTVLRYVRDGLRRSVTGNYFARPSDNIRRRLKFLSDRGMISITVTDSRDATLVSKYMTAVKRYLLTGRESFLAPFRRKRLGPYRFVTDPEALDMLADAGELEFDSLYNFVFGART
jgi:hypothetical protein